MIMYVVGIYFLLYSFSHGILQLSGVPWDSHGTLICEEVQLGSVWELSTCQIIIEKVQNQRYLFLGKNKQKKIQRFFYEFSNLVGDVFAN
jgi:hypothetical protein